MSAVAYEDIRWVSANTLVEELTRRIAREFKCSKPKPRNRAMGFTGRDDLEKWRRGLEALTS